MSVDFQFTDVGHELGWLEDDFDQRQIEAQAQREIYEAQTAEATPSGWRFVEVVADPGE